MQYAHYHDIGDKFIRFNAAFFFSLSSALLKLLLLLPLYLWPPRRQLYHSNVKAHGRNKKKLAFHVNHPKTDLSHCSQLAFSTPAPLLTRRAEQSSHPHPCHPRSQSLAYSCSLLLRIPLRHANSQHRSDLFWLVMGFTSSTLWL